ncbi:MAG: lipoxygenase [Symploca sp. SIO1B1]|nr:lipoxygenase [Symploca sp. SIO1C2]NER97180.1 lipoxygenase [Symploca sp. SIO1B1]
MNNNSNEYEYDYNTNFAPLAMLKVPDKWAALKQIAGWDWLLKVVEQVILVSLNSFFTNQSLHIDGIEEDLKAVHKLYTSGNIKQMLSNSGEIERIIESLHLAVKKSQDSNILEHFELFKKIRQQFKDEKLKIEDVLELVKLLKNQPKEAAEGGRPDTLEGYEAQFCEIFIPLPKISQNFQDDLQFANMRVAGPNPLVIERMTKELPRFPVTEEQYQSVMKTSDSIQQAISDGRLYLTDYGVFENALQGTYPQEQKYICAPLAMFAVPEKGHKHYPHLCPIAIQCFQKPGPNNPIFTPKDENWLIAKTIVQIADINFHEAISHLGQTHLFMEPFVLATHRILPENHPLRKLLLPHFEGTLLINWGAQNSLMSRNGDVDKLLASTINTSCVVATQGAQEHLLNFNGSMLKETLKRRRVDDCNKLPYYPYRDDSLKIWEAIQTWVKGYLQEHYTDDTKVQSDKDLQDWVKELLSHEGGRLKNFGEDGQICTLDYLIEATTMIIFTASAQHAAVNFPQSKIMSYTPAMPGAGYAPAPTTTTGSGDDKALIQFLPPLDIARTQLNLAHLLGSVYYTQLGYYPSEFEEALSNDQQNSLKKFQTDLQEIEKEIKARNNDNPNFPYVYLMPTQIPQSINI